MSVIVNLAVLAEGLGSDSRGLLTLIAVNPQSLVAEQLPAQFAPVFVVAIEEDASPGAATFLAPGRTASVRVQAADEDGNVVFYSQQEQVVPPAPHPNLPARMQLIAQVPFAAQKGGLYEISARITLHGPDGQDEEVRAARNILVMDVATLKGGAS
jgi:hypothetical protein